MISLFDIDIHCCLCLILYFYFFKLLHRGFPDTSVGKESAAMWETWVRFLGWKDPLEKGKTAHASILAWRISWTVQSMGLQRVGHE